MAEAYLILILATWRGGTAIESVPMPSREVCEAAAAQYVEQTKDMAYELRAYCTPPAKTRVGQDG